MFVQESFADYHGIRPHFRFGVSMIASLPRPANVALHNVSWEAYERLADAAGESHARFTLSTLASRSAPVVRQRLRRR